LNSLNALSPNEEAPESECSQRPTPRNQLSCQDHLERPESSDQWPPSEAASKLCSRRVA